LRRIATDGPDVLYAGELASRIASVCWLGEQDLADFEPTWVSPLKIDYRNVTVCELPPPTQGVAALEALGLLGLGAPTLSAQVECVQLALEDARARVRDGADVTDLLSADHLRARRGSPRGPVAEPPGGTVYLCVVDGNGMAVSFIQSLYEAFGSGVVAPETGVVLQNRCACFAVAGAAVEPGRRPYHTIIPGMLLRDGELLGSFGVVGGFMQAQGHLQVVSGLIDDDLDPQAALDRSRFRVRGAEVLLEEGLWERSTELEALGLRPVLSADASLFGGGQAILLDGGMLVGGSDRRKDGSVVGL
jgi:gamma-glutamyltranspeptidase/glutathione hydrolase